MKMFPAHEHFDLLASVVANFLRAGDRIAAFDAQVIEIDSQHAGGEEFCTQHDIPYEAGANCIIVEAIRGDRRRLAACVYPVGTRVNLNKSVRKALDARRVSMAPAVKVIELTGMENGSITPLGLPEAWPILIDASLAAQDHLFMGSGQLNTKVRIRTNALLQQNNVRVIDDLAS